MLLADQSSVVSRAAYVLFYRRRDLPQTPLPQVSATPMPVNPVPSKRYDSDSDDSDSEDEKKSTREVEMDEY